MHQMEDTPALASTSKKIPPTHWQRNKYKQEQKLREIARKERAKDVAKRHKKWSCVETELFYKRLSQYSTDFPRIALTLNRLPEEIVDKYNDEKNKEPQKVLRALTNRLPIEKNPVSHINPRKPKRKTKQRFVAFQPIRLQLDAPIFDVPSADTGPAPATHPHHPVPYYAFQQGTSLASGVGTADDPISLEDEPERSEDEDGSEDECQKLLECP